MIDCVRIKAGPCSTIEIDRGTMEIVTKGEDTVKYPMPQDLVDYIVREDLTSIPTNFGKRNPKTTIRLEIKCLVCTSKIPAHPNGLASHVNGRQHVRALLRRKAHIKDMEAKQRGLGPNASPSSGQFPRRHPSVYGRPSPYDRPSTSATRSYAGYNRQPVNSPSRASSAYDRPGPSSAYDRPGHSYAYDRPEPSFAYDRSGPSHDRREEPPSRMNSDSSSGSDDNPRTYPRTYAEWQAMKAAK